MGEKGMQNRFNGAAWFDQQVCNRTRAALAARGCKAKTHSREYQTEYARQLVLFREERAEVKRRRQEKYLARMKKTMTAESPGVG